MFPFLFGNSCQLWKLFTMITGIQTEHVSCPQCAYEHALCTRIESHLLQTINCRRCGHSTVSEPAVDENGEWRRTPSGIVVMHHTSTPGYGVWIRAGRDHTGVETGKFDETVLRNQKLNLMRTILRDPLWYSGNCFITHSSGQRGSLEFLLGIASDFEQQMS